MWCLPLAQTSSCHNPVCCQSSIRALNDVGLLMWKASFDLTHCWVRQELKPQICLFIFELTFLLCEWYLLSHVSPSAEQWSSNWRGWGRRVPPWQALVGMEGGRIFLVVFSSLSSERQYCCLQKAVYYYPFALHILCDVVWVMLM